MKEDGKRRFVWLVGRTRFYSSRRAIILNFRRIARFALEQREREAIRLASKKEALDRGAQLLQELTRKMMAERDAREEMETAILDLAEEEKVGALSLVIFTKSHRSAATKGLDGF